MAKAKIAFRGNFPILEWNFMRGPMAIIKAGDRQLHIVGVKRLDEKFFMTKFGVFELDGEHEHRMSNQTFLVYNLHNAKPLPLRAIEKIQKFYREGDADVIVKECELINNIKAQDTKKTDTIKIMNDVYEKAKQASSKLDQETLKGLIDYRTYDNKDVSILSLNHIEDKKIRGYSSLVSTYMPMLIVGGMAIGLVLFMRFFNPLKLFGIVL
jgi:hypothetical protein